MPSVVHPDLLADDRRRKDDSTCLVTEARTVALTPVAKPLQVDAGTYSQQGKDVIACFDLPRGPSRLAME
ncbi:hypothetical protein [Aquisphaera insulae]|uniref:hypothetical protein n=1 Tax=Aquisphaera insulae TaxID=2712864 RepID=UPI0013EA3CB6|nr:hypothetical protein [Aquisphaera insulae]